MTTHAEMATQLLHGATNGTPLTNGEKIQVALVEATLELALQRRAATLLAYERLQLGRPDSDNRRPLLALPDSPWLREVDAILDLEEIGERWAAAS